MSIIAMFDVQSLFQAEILPLLAQHCYFLFFQCAAIYAVLCACMSLL